MVAGRSCSNNDCGACENVRVFLSRGPSVDPFGGDSEPGLDCCQKDRILANGLGVQGTRHLSGK